MTGPTENRNKLVAFRTDVDSIVEGSIRMRCAKCGHEVWVSATSVKVMEEQDAVPLCVECTIDLHEQKP